MQRNCFLFFHLEIPEREWNVERHEESIGNLTLQAVKVPGEAGSLAPLLRKAMTSTHNCLNCLRTFSTVSTAATCQAKKEHENFHFEPSGGREVWSVTRNGWAPRGFQWRIEGREFRRAVYAEASDGVRRPQFPVANVGLGT